MKKIFILSLLLSISNLNQANSWTNFKQKISAYLNKIFIAYESYNANKEFEKLVTRSDQFVTNFPTQNNRIKILAENNKEIQTKIVRQAKNSYPIIHQDVLNFIPIFLNYKRTYGSNIERTFYESINPQTFIDRLLTNRPLMFMTQNDHYLLQDNKEGYGGFEAIGTTQECEPLTLSNYISYDEMQIAALIGVSSPTFFINNGNRNNNGIKSNSNDYEKEGIFAGLVGARFEKPNRMEWQHIIVTPNRNTELIKEKSFFKIWSNLYNQSFETYQQAANNKTNRYIKFNHAGNECFFDTLIYKKRLAFVIEPFLKDAQKRASSSKQKAYIHATGLGLGVWKIIPEQAQLLVDVYSELLTKMQNELNQISDINFSYFPPNMKWNGPHNSIKIHFSSRNPADILQNENQGKLLIAQYAWDGNSYPGNEYWHGYLNASGDPAAACCSTIAELQNPKINLHVCAQNMA